VWANRFYFTPLDEERLWAAVRYVELNPVRACLVSQAEQYPWSSALVHCGAEAPRNAGHGGLSWPTSPFPGEVSSAGGPIGSTVRCAPNRRTASAAPP